MRVVADEVDSNFGSVTLENPEQAFGDAAIASVTQTFLGVAPPGDLLRFEAALTEDFDTSDSSAWGAVTYRFPFGGSGAYAEAYVAGVNARRDASGTLAATDIKGSTAVFAAAYPVVRNIDTYGYALGEIRRSGSEVDVSDTRFESEVEAIGLSWIYGKAVAGGGAYEYALNLVAGQRSTGADGFDDGDENFVHLRFGAGAEHPTTWLGENTTIRAEVWGQYSPDRLPSVEEFYIGGRGEERGYRFAEASGDNGISASVELARDVFFGSGALRRLQPSTFVDVGWVEENDPGTAEIAQETLASFGFGLGAEYSGDIFVRGHVAVPLLDGPSTDAGDPSLYLALTKSW